MRKGALFCQLGLIVALMLISSLARGQQIRLVSEGCEELDTEEIERLLLIEVKEAAKRAGKTANLTVVLKCEGPTIRIVTNDHLSEKQLERSIQLLSKTIKERVIALSTSQLVTVSWLETTGSKEPLEERTKGEAAIPSESETKPDQSTQNRLELSVAGGFKQCGDLTIPTGSAGLRGDIWFNNDIGLMALVSFDGGSSSRTIGSVTTLAAMSGLGLGWRFFNRGMFAVESSLFALVGYAHLKGNPDESATGSSTGGITGEFDLKLSPTLLLGSVVMALDIEGGYILKNPIGRVADDKMITVGGLWIGAAIRIGLVKQAHRVK